jgi:hypothetical protein
MRLIAVSSWTTIWLIAATWAFALVLANAIAVWWSIRASNASGDLAAVGGGLTLRGAIVVFGPPLALLALKWIVGRR